MDATTIVPAAIFAILWIAEITAPFYADYIGSPGAKIRHDLRNLAFGAANASIMVVLFSGGLAAIEVWASDRGFGILRALAWPLWLETIVVFIVFDLWMYVWHFANHKIPLLWRFHRVHHTETHLDASSGLRFHPGEIFLSGLMRFAIFAIAGVTLWQLAVYEAALFSVVLFHHSNIALPRWLDRGMLVIVVTPAMHRVHHSRVHEETDSNYSSVFPWWDMLLRTLRLREDARTVHTGLNDFDDAEWQSVLGVLKTPFRTPNKPTGVGGGEARGG